MSVESGIPASISYLRSIQPDVPSIRLKQKEALDPQVLFRNLDVQKVLQMQIADDATIGFYNVYSPYAPEDGLHLMGLDATRSGGKWKYRATPTQIPLHEGEALMQLTGRIADFQSKMPGTRVVSWAFNNSPWNFGKAEEKAGGYQSIPTVFHGHIWNRPTDTVFAPMTDIPDHTRRFLEGDGMTRFAGRLIKDRLATIAQPFIDMKTVTVDRTGFHAWLDGTLFDALRTPGFFSDFIRPLHMQIEQATIALGKAVTTTDFSQLSQMIQKSFEEGDSSIYSYLQEPPKLIPLYEREKNIDELRAAGYSDAMIKVLQRFSPRLKDRDEVSERDYFRKGFGYALSIQQDITERHAKIDVRPAGLIRTSVGGVVEAQKRVMKRSETTEQNDKIIQKNIKNVNDLIQYLEKEYPNQAAA